MFFRIDENRSSDNVTVVQGDTAMLVCTVLYVGDKSVGNICRSYDYCDSGTGRQSRLVCTNQYVGDKSVQKIGHLIQWIVTRDFGVI
jgi:hypothetical protein